MNGISGTGRIANNTTDALLVIHDERDGNLFAKGFILLTAVLDLIVQMYQPGTRNCGENA